VLIDRIAGARVAGATGLCALDLRDGRVAEVALEGEREAGHEGEHEGERRPSPAEVTLEAAGRVVLPAFVDAHVHLDKAFLLADAEAAGPLRPTLDAAIASVGALRASLAPARVRAIAERAITRLVRHGVTAARVHVEIDPAVGLDLVHLHKALADTAARRLALQLVAFPQRGLELPGMIDLFGAALGLGLDVVGGCPYVDADPRRHLDLVFAMAERHGAPVDLHLDFSDDPGRSLLGLVAERTRAHGMQGRVAIGHVTTLAAMPPDAQAEALDLLAACGIALIALPATDLYLTGHGEPGARSLAPWERARQRGVRVAIANNNLGNPFAPFGNGNILQAAWLAGITRHACGPESRAALLDAVTQAPAAILGLPEHGPRVDAAAHLVIVDTEEPEDVILEAPTVLTTLRAGAVVHETHPPRIAH
jgi:cytosine deaminase